MGKVTKIEKQKKRDNRFNIFIDEKFAISVSNLEIIDFDIYLGKEISDKELEEIKSSSSFVKIKNKALRLLSIRPRSMAELEEKLLEKKYHQNEVKKVIDDLVKLELLNDEKFTEDWINHRLNFSSLGKRRIFLELRKKKVNTEIIDKKLSKISQKEEFNKALELAERKVLTYKDEDKYKKRQKLIGFLLRKGYSWEIINLVLGKIIF